MVTYNILSLVKTTINVTHGLEPQAAALDTDMSREPVAGPANANPGNTASQPSLQQSRQQPASPQSRSAKSTTKQAKPLELSTYYMSCELHETYRGLDISIPARVWQDRFGAMLERDFAAILLTMAKRVNPSNYKKNPRSDKKPPPKRTGKSPHISTARVLEARKQTKSKK
jgi:hypothetical protein